MDNRHLDREDNYGGGIYHVSLSRRSGAQRNEVWKNTRIPN
jgi:hypothetical protein